MDHNPILEELYSIRERLLSEAGGDLAEFLAGVREREAASGRLLESEGQITAEDGDPARGPARKFAGAADRIRLTR